MKLPVGLCFLAAAMVSAQGVPAENHRQLSMELLESARDGRIEEVERLLDSGVPIKARNRFGNTALIYAARSCHRDLLEVLIERGADVNQTNLNGHSPLFEAAKGGCDRSGWSD